MVLPAHHRPDADRVGQVAGEGEDKGLRPDQLGKRPPIAGTADDDATPRSPRSVRPEPILQPSTPGSSATTPSTHRLDTGPVSTYREDATTDSIITSWENYYKEKITQHLSFHRIVRDE